MDNQSNYNNGNNGYGGGGYGSGGPGNNGSNGNNNNGNNDKKDNFEWSISDDGKLTVTESCAGKLYTGVNHPDGVERIYPCITGSIVHYEHGHEPVYFHEHFGDQLF